MKPVGRLRRAKRRVTLQLRVVATGGAANRAVRSRTIKLR